MESAGLLAPLSLCFEVQEGLLKCILEAINCKSVLLLWGVDQSGQDKLGGGECVGASELNKLLFGWSHWQVF